MNRIKKKTELETYKEKSFKIYKSWKKIYSPALKADVLFTRWGWNHIVQKRGRTGKEQLYRLRKLQFVPLVIKSSQCITEERRQEGFRTFMLMSMVGSIRIKVVIYKKVYYYYFVSVI